MDELSETLVNILGDKPGWTIQFEAMTKLSAIKLTMRAKEHKIDMYIFFRDIGMAKFNMLSENLRDMERRLEESEPMRQGSD